MQPHRKKQWGLKSGVDALFVAQMEAVLRWYAKPYDPSFPVVCFDEKGKELLLEVSPEVPLQIGKVAKQDYEYRHNGACNLFMLYEPHTGYRHVQVTNQRRAVDCADFLRWMVEVAYPVAEEIVVICDNLNIHSLSGLYQTYSAEVAGRIAAKLRFVHTPKHASWLNMVETLIGILAKQCLKPRMGEIEFVASEVTACEVERNRQAAKIKWQFSCDLARTKLHRLYPISI